MSLNEFELKPGKFAMIAGPCSIESHQQFSETAQFVKANGACALRGGVFKMRTNPNSFQGLGYEALEMADEVKAQHKMPFVCEVTDPRQIDKFLPSVDMFQVGARNMHNYELLKELGRTQKPILLKRNFSALIDEWLLAADYIVQAGNQKVIFCERGIRTFETKTRNTLDLNAVAYIKKNSSFPVFVDPSHGVGISDLVTPMALAAAAAGADGLIVEVHPEPAKALSDADQALSFSQFAFMMDKLAALLPIVGKELQTLPLTISDQAVRSTYQEFRV